MRVRKAPTVVEPNPAEILRRMFFLSQPSATHVQLTTSLHVLWLLLELEDDWPECIFPQVLIQPRRHLFTLLRRACLHAAMLNVYGHMRAPSHRPSFLSNCAARFLTKVVCASCIVPGCSASCCTQVLCASCSAQVL